MSGMTMSMPGMSSSGNMRPVSTQKMASSYSYTIRFLPNSPRPPSGMMRRASVSVVFELGVNVKLQGERLRVSELRVMLVLWRNPR